MKGVHLKKDIFFCDILMNLRFIYFKFNLIILNLTFNLKPFITLLMVNINLLVNDYCLTNEMRISCSLYINLSEFNTITTLFLNILFCLYCIYYFFNYYYYTQSSPMS